MSALPMAHKHLQGIVPLFSLPSSLMCSSCAHIVSDRPFRRSSAKAQKSNGPRGPSNKLIHTGEPVIRRAMVQMMTAVGSPLRTLAAKTQLFKARPPTDFAAAAASHKPRHSPSPPLQRRSPRCRPRRLRWRCQSRCSRRGSARSSGWSRRRRRPRPRRKRLARTESSSSFALSSMPGSTRPRRRNWCSLSVRPG